MDRALTYCSRQHRHQCRKAVNWCRRAHVATTTWVRAYIKERVPFITTLMIFSLLPSTYSLCFLCMHVLVQQRIKVPVLTKIRCVDHSISPLLQVVTCSIISHHLSLSLPEKLMHLLLTPLPISQRRHRMFIRIYTGDRHCAQVVRMEQEPQACIDSIIIQDFPEASERRSSWALHVVHHNLVHVKVSWSQPDSAEVPRR